MQERLRGTNIHNIKQVIDMLRKILRSLTTEYIEKLVKSMDKRWLYRLLIVVCV